MGKVDTDQAGGGKARQQSGRCRTGSATKINNADRIETDHFEALKHAGSDFPVQGISLAECRSRTGKIALDGGSIDEERFIGEFGRTIHGIAIGTGLVTCRAPDR